MSQVARSFARIHFDLSQSNIKDMRPFIFIINCQQLESIFYCIFNNSSQALRPMSIKKTEQFIYLQSKAKHYDNIKKAKPLVQSFRSVSPPPPYRRLSVMKEYDDLKTNECLVNNILSIRNSLKARVELQNGYTRYNDFECLRKTKSKTFRDFQKSQTIDSANKKLGTKILNIKPSVGTITDWNEHHDIVQNRKRIASKLRNSKIISIYTRNKFMPEHYKSFIEKDGSTVAIRQKIFELPHLMREHDSPGKSPRMRGEDLDWKKIIKDTSGEFRM